MVPFSLKKVGECHVFLHVSLTYICIKNLQTTLVGIVTEIISHLSLIFVVQYCFVLQCFDSWHGWFCIGKGTEPA